MRFLGIDYGAKRVGVAISDEGGEFALPLSVLPNDRSLLGAVAKIAAEKKIGAVVLGQSLNFKGAPNPIMKKIEKLKGKLEAGLRLTVHLEPEFLTSAEAERLKPRPPAQSRRSGLRLRRPEVKNKMLDASAAALILKSYLDKEKRV